MCGVVLGYIFDDDDDVITKGSRQIYILYYFRIRNDIIKPGRVMDNFSNER